MSSIEEPAQRQRMRLVASTDWAQPTQEDAPEPTPATRPASGRKPVVLIATRELQMRAFGTTVLKRAGFRVEAQTRGEEILAGLDSMRPDLILTDPSLDDMNAARLCSQVREMTAGATVPVLVISEDPDSPNIQQILSDDSIVDILRRDGVEIARRTVAKYRDAMRIPSSVERRRRKAIQEYSL